MTNKKGFTIVELLIVVSIIGVLATVGIPTFKKMVQKAKRAEAKTVLAGIFTAESAFQAEYGTYGNRLSKIGFEMSAGVQSYTSGFPSATCATNVILPAKGTPPGNYLDSIYSSYYNEATEAHTSLVVAEGSRKPEKCEEGIVGTDGNTYLATASGVISPSALVTDLAQIDRWTMNQKKELKNTNDGVK